MSDPSEDWASEWIWPSADIEQIASVRQIEGGWIRSVRTYDDASPYVFSIQRATSLTGTWTEEIDDANTPAATVNGRVAYFVTDGTDWVLRWSNHAFNSSGESSLPSGWSPYYFDGQGMYHNLFWDGERFGIFLRDSFSTDAAFAYTTSLSGTWTIAQEFPSDLGIIMSGVAGSGWAFSVSDINAGTYRRRMFYADDFTGPWTARELASDPDDWPTNRVAVWNGQQLIILNGTAMSSATSLGGTFSTVSPSPIPAGMVFAFDPSVDGDGYAGESGVAWDAANELWVVAGRYNVYTAADLTGVWGESDIVYDGAAAQGPVAISNYDGEWLLGILGGGPGEFLAPTGGAGWEIVL